MEKNTIKKICTLLPCIMFVLKSNIYASEVKKPIRILISQSASHPALDTTTKGVIDAIKDAGYVEGENLDLRIESAQANSALAAQIATKFVQMNADVVVAIATVSAQSLAKAANEGKVKLAFSTVTDPLGSHIVNTLEVPGNNTSGVSNFVDLRPQIMLFQRIQPTLKRLGIIYNPGEINGVKIIKELERVCKSLNLVLIKQTVTRTGDVPQAAAKLAATVDAIFISNDNTALSGFQRIIKAARDAQKPVYVSDTDEVSQGAVAALGPNQYEVGQQTGRVVIRAINGEDLGIIPVGFPSNTELHLNLDAARRVGINIPQDIIRSATKIID